MDANPTIAGAKPATAASESGSAAKRASLLRRSVSRVLAGAIALAISLLLGELLVRVAAPQPASWLDIYRRHPTLPLFATQPQAERLVDTGETLWRIRTDKDGFRISATVTPDSAAGGSTRPVLCLGDSFTFGHGVDHEASFVGILESELRPRRRVVNAATCGYGLIQYRQVLEYLLGTGLEPGVVLVGVFLGNDFFDCVWNKDVPIVDGILGNERSLKSFLRRRSHLYRLASKVYHRSSSIDGGGAQHPADMYAAVNWDSGELARARSVFADEIGRINQICAARSIPLFVLVIPTREAVDSARGESSATTGSENDPLLPNKHAAEILGALGVRSYDVTPDLARHPTDEIYFRYDGHLTPSANRLVADVLQERFEELRP